MHGSNRKNGHENMGFDRVLDCLQIMKCYRILKICRSLKTSVLLLICRFLIMAQIHNRLRSFELRVHSVACHSFENSL